MKTKRTARFVIGYKGDDHVIFPHGEVVYEGDRVLFVGHNYPGNVDQTLDDGDSIIAPGFVDLNALGDIDQSLLWSESLEWRAMLWSEDFVMSGPREAMTAEENAFKSRYALVQLLLNGITTALPVTGLEYRSWAESYSEFEAIAKFATQIGMRAYLGPSFRSGVEFIRSDGTVGKFWDEERGQKGLEEAVRFVQDFDGYGDGLIRGLLVPSQLQTCTTELLRETKAHADALDCPIRLHAAQSLREFNYSLEHYEKTPVAFLDSINFLGPRTLIPHAIYISGSSRVSEPGHHDLDLFRDSDTTVIHCPLVLARGGIHLESFDKFQQHGISIALGTDTFPPDMLENIRIGGILNQIHHRGDAGSRPADFYRAATLGGARALGRDDLGRLAKGSKADLIVLSLKGMTVGQYDDPIETMAFSMNSSDIQTVVINGRVVMEERKIPGLENERLRHRSQAYFEKLKESYAQRDYQNRPADTLFRSSFPVIHPKDAN